MYANKGKMEQFHANDELKFRTKEIFPQQRSGPSEECLITLSSQMESLIADRRGFKWNLEPGDKTESAECNA